jgi:hypothetical protein
MLQLLDTSLTTMVQIGQKLELQDKLEIRKKIDKGPETLKPLIIKLQKKIDQLLEEK